MPILPKEYFEVALEQYFQSKENITEQNMLKEKGEEPFPKLSSHKEFEKVLSELLGTTPKFDVLDEEEEKEEKEMDEKEEKEQLVKDIEVEVKEVKKVARSWCIIS